MGLARYVSRMSLTRSDPPGADAIPAITRPLHEINAFHLRGRSSDRSPSPLRFRDGREGGANRPLPNVLLMQISI